MPNLPDGVNPPTGSGFVAAADAGISAIPVDSASKRALVRWGMFQEQIPDLLQLQEWDRAGHNIAFVTGQVSGRLVCLDFEVGFMGRLVELRARLDDAGVLDVFETWVKGYSESTPSGGMHILVRVEGDGPLDGNTKLAADPAGKVQVETRGEGGYVIVAPSVGWVQIVGGVDTIAYATLEEWRLVEAVLRSFDTPTSAAAPTVPARSTAGLDPMLRDDHTWMDEAVAALGDIRTVLSAHGWQPTGRRDTYGEHWTRPGKDPREGSSGSISVNNRLFVHSSNTGMHVGNPTYDVLDVTLFYALGRDPTDRERVDYARQAQPPTPADGAGAGAAPAVEGVADLNLPPEFWEARPYLAHIHQAALSLRLSPDAVWAGIKCFYAATIPWNHRLPGDGTLDYIAIVVGSSGAGKSRAKHAAYLLLENCRHIDGVYFPVPAGSGEGLTEFYLDRTDNDRRYKARGVGFYADEGRFLLDISSRPGNTTMQAVKQMWSGELTGSVAATSDRHRWLDPRDVRGTLLISTTPEVAAEFMSRDYTDEGLPQRISWAWAHYPHPDTKPEWPGPLDLQAFDYNRTGDNLYHIDVAPDLLAAIDTRQLAAARGQHTDGLEGHATYAILKCAAIHAHLDHRMNINDEDWALAAKDWETTGNIRRHVQTTYHQGIKDRNAATGTARAHQRIAETDVYLERAIHSLVRKLKNSKEPLTKDQIRTHLASYRKRHQIPSQEVIDLATTRGLVTLTAEGSFRAGS